MNYFPLLFILPPEIIQLIYVIILREENVNKIIHFYHTRKNKHYIVSEVIKTTVYNAQIYYGKLRLMLLDDYINNLKFILQNNFSKFYDRRFWFNLITDMSYKLMHMHNNICMQNKNKYDNSYYKNLKTCISLWFELCKKFNVKLCLFYRKFKSNTYDATYIKARHLIKLNNFHKFLHTPSIVYEDDIRYHDFVDKDLAPIILLEYLGVDV